MCMVSTVDVAVVGAGVVGLSCALELRRRGARVVVLEQAPEGQRRAGQASWAAAGMLAVEDPHHPAELRELARRSGALYDDFLERIASAGGGTVPYQTRRTRVITAGAAEEIAERSIDPRQLMAALEQAVPAVRGFDAVRVQTAAAGCVLQAADGRSVGAAQVLWTEGAWARSVAGIVPRKGQMLCVEMPPDAERDVVLRADDVYVVPRTRGPMAGRALVGATVEDVGFDTGLAEDALEDLRARGARLAAWVGAARRADAWSGLRPATASGLPLMGQVDERQFVATGHFRNGILLAPATAEMMADVLTGAAAKMDMSAFAPAAVGAAHAGR